MSNPVLEAISERRSIRAYKPEPVTKEQVELLIKAALEAPSARNGQPWHFAVVQDASLLAEINEEALKNLKSSASDIFHGATTAIFISCAPDTRWGRLDSGIAVENIHLAAHSLGLGSVVLGLPEAAFAKDKKEYFSKILKFPEGHAFAVAIAIGVPNGTKESHPIGSGKVDYIVRE
ncbi:MAG: nitroreductase [Clostridiales bacterium]|jgi:nitroreductase|nr:nitroreductase [Clostridiales bacterium]